MKTAQQAASNWQASQGRAATAYQQGVEGFTGDWAGKTVAQQNAMLQGMTQAVSSGLWAQRVNAVGTAGWKSATVAKVTNYSTGFSAGAQRQAAAAQKIQAALGNLVPALPARGDFNQNKVRMIALVDGLHALRGQLGAS